MPTNNTPDNWACFRRILEQLLENLELQAELVKSLLEEGDHADHLDFIDQLQFDTAPQAVALLDDWKPRRMVDAPNRNRAWTEAEHNELRALFKYGLSDAELAEFFGRSTDAIERRRGALGLRRDI